MTEIKLIRIATFDNEILANIARSRLEAEEIRAFLEDDNVIAMDWMKANAVGGIKLVVPIHEIDNALRVLKEKTGNQQDNEIEKNLLFLDNPFACPKCGSSEVFRERLNRRWVFLSVLLLGLPLPFLSKKTICADCDHRW